MCIRDSFYASSARQGFRWWEIDLTWYGLRLMALLGLVRDLKPVSYTHLDVYKRQK